VNEVKGGAFEISQGNRRTGHCLEVAFARASGGAFLLTQKKTSKLVPREKDAQLVEKEIRSLRNTAGGGGLLPSFKGEKQANP